MRWLTFLVLAVLVVTLQTTLAPRLRLFGVAPDWILVFVVFCGMHVKGLDAVLAGWALGLLADFHTAQRFGMMSICYALVAAVVSLTRGWVFPRHPLAHFAATLIAGVMLYVPMAVGPVAIGGAVGGWDYRLVGPALLVALYSAAWAPVVQWVLLKIGPWMGLDRPRYTHLGLGRAV